MFADSNSAIYGNAARSLAERRARYTVNGTNDKAPRTEEPRDRETIMRGSVNVAAHYEYLMQHMEILQKMSRARQRRRPKRKRR
jgi:hypothetical protein